MSDWMHKIVLDCEKASLLTIKKEEGKLSFLEKFQLWLHIKICGPCEEFDHQNHVINTNMKFHFRDEQVEEKMPATLKEKLEEVVNNS